MSDVVVRGAGGDPILQVATLRLAKGEAVGISGPSGAGKSTLLHVLAGLLKPSRGQVLWGGCDLAALSESARDAFRRRSIGLIFQEALLFEELSAGDNAALSACFAPRRERSALQARAQALLSRLAIAPSARDASRLSGGERQRVSMARALAADPPVVLADEPTASLDRATADGVIADLLRLAREQGRTVIAVSHDPALLTAMDRVTQVADGRVQG